MYGIILGRSRSRLRLRPDQKVLWLRLRNPDSNSVTFSDSHISMRRKVQILSTRLESVFPIISFFEVWFYTDKLLVPYLYRTVYFNLYRYHSEVVKPIEYKILF